jgi:hypothetical protein
LIPLPEILAELIMALGGALFVGGAWALLQPYVRPTTEARVQARGRVLVNMAIGLIVFVWGFASFIAR